MADQVDEIKQKTDIVSLIGEHVELKRAGRNFRALCPFHSEKTPSFMVSPELQIYKCFGCGEAGDAFTFLERYEGMDFGEALVYLAEKAGVKLTPSKFAATGEKEKLFEINLLAARLYHYLLLRHKVGRAALTYLAKQRGLTVDTIKEFQIGYSPETSYALKSFLVDKKGHRLGDIQKTGLILEKDRRVIDRFSGRIIFPLFDHRGNVCGFAGRAMPSKEDGLAKYINSPETPVYHKSRLLYGLNLSRTHIKEKDSAVVVEGELDMISCWQSGFKNTVGIKGSALTEDQIRLLSRFSKKATLALDADFAGSEATRRGITISQNFGIEVKVANLKDYKDPDEMVRKNPEAFAKSLKEAQGAWDFIIDSIFAKYNATSGEGKAKISRELIPVLSSIPDKIVQAHYIELVARRLRVSAEAVSNQLIQTSEKKTAEEKKVVVGQKVEEKSRRELLEERLLTLCFQSKPEILLEDKVEKLIKTPLSRRIHEEYKKFAQGTKSFDPSLFSEKLPKELMEGFAEMILADTEEFLERPERLNKELGLVKKELGLLAIKEELKKAEETIVELEKSGKKKKLEDAKTKFAHLTDKLTALEDEETQGIILE